MQAQIDTLSNENNQLKSNVEQTRQNLSKAEQEKWIDAEEKTRLGNEIKQISEKYIKDVQQMRQLLSDSKNDNAEKTTKITALSQLVKKLENDVKIYSKENNDLKTSVDVIQISKFEVEQINSSLTQKIDSLNQQIEKMMEEKNLLEQNFNAQIIMLQERIVNSENAIKSPNTENESPAGEQPVNYNQL